MGTNLARLASREPAFFGSGNFSRVMRRVRFSPDGATWSSAIGGPGRDLAERHRQLADRRGHG
jgi:hypothetical protein